MTKEIANMTRNLAGDDHEFGGIVIDTACTGASVVSSDEYTRYCRDTGSEYHILPNSSGCVRFGDSKKGTTKGRLKSLGRAKIRGSVSSLDETFEFYAHVVPATDTPLLMSLNDLNGLGYEFRTGSNTLWSKDRANPKSKEFPHGPHHLARDDHGRGVIRWNYCSTAFFTNVELKKFHHSYGHASSKKIISALEEAGFDDLPSDTKQSCKTLRVIVTLVSGTFNVRDISAYLYNGKVRDLTTSFSQMSRISVTATLFMLSIQQQI
jgi:hypothetical protein